MTITVYGPKSCVQCKATTRYLDSAGITYTYVTLDDHPKIAEQLRNEGYRQAPVVFAGNEKWSGFQPSKLRTLAEIQAAK